MKMHLDPAVYENMVRTNELLKHQLEIAQRYDGAYWMAEATRLASELRTVQVEAQNGGFGWKRRILAHINRALTPTPRQPEKRSAH